MAERGARQGLAGAVEPATWITRLPLGAGLQRPGGVLERACRALPPIEPQMVSFGGNDRNLSFVVRAEHQQQAVRRLHAEFFGTTATRSAQPQLEENAS